MPEILIYAVEGRTADVKQALMRDVTDAVVRNFGVHPDLVTIQIVEAKACDKAKGGIPYAVRPPSDIFPG